MQSTPLQHQALIGSDNCETNTSVSALNKADITIGKKNFPTRDRVEAKMTTFRTKGSKVETKGTLNGSGVKTESKTELPLCIANDLK